MDDRSAYELGANIQRLLAHSRRTNMKLDTIDKKLDLIRRGQSTDQQLAELVIQVDSITKQLKRTVNPQGVEHASHNCRTADEGE